MRDKEIRIEDRANGWEIPIFRRMREGSKAQDEQAEP
mgnify:CR=1 FL=1